MYISLLKLCQKVSISSFLFFYQSCLFFSQLKLFWKIIFIFTWIFKYRSNFLTKIWQIFKNCNCSLRIFPLKSISFRRNNTLFSFSQNKYRIHFFACYSVGSWDVLFDVHECDSLSKRMGKPWCVAEALRCSAKLHATL